MDTNRTDTHVELNEYAAGHFYAQGQQWVPEYALTAARQEIDRMRALVVTVLHPARHYLAQLEHELNGVPEEGEAGDRGLWDHYRSVEAVIRDATEALDRANPH